MSALPEGASCTRTTGWFTADDVPAALLGEHSTKAGVWGVIRVGAGRLRVVLAGPPERVLELAPDEVAVSAPQEVHRVAPLTPETTFRVEFFREAQDPPGGEIAETKHPRGKGG